MESLPKSRKEAKEQGATRYFTGKPCKHGHVDFRYVSGSKCATCCKNDDVIWKKRNPECARKYYETHSEYIKQRNRLYRAKNSWRHNQSEAHRRATKQNATPSWIDQAEIRVIYETCPKGYHVDHIIPLKGENVCGLHVPWNLQHLPATENIRKSNKLLPDLVQAET